MAVASSSRIMLPAKKQTWSRNGLRSRTTSLRCWLGLQLPQISIQSSICGKCWTDHGPTSQLPIFKGSVANILVPGITAHLQGSNGIHTSTGQCCFDIKWGQHNIQQMVIMLWLISVICISILNTRDNNCTWSASTVTTPIRAFPWVGCVY